MAMHSNDLYVNPSLQGVIDGIQEAYPLFELTANQKGFGNGKTIETLSGATGVKGRLLDVKAIYDLRTNMVSLDFALKQGGSRKRMHTNAAPSHDDLQKAVQAALAALDERRH